MTSKLAAGLLIGLTLCSGANAQTKAAGAVTAAPAATATAPAAAAAPAFHAGIWEVTIAESPVGSNAKRTTVSRICYQPTDAKALERMVPQQRNFGMSCENHDVKAQGAEATWKIACKGKEGTTAGTATMTYAAESYTAQAKVDTRLGGKPGKVEQTITGKRIGDCK